MLTPHSKPTKGTGGTRARVLPTHPVKQMSASAGALHLAPLLALMHIWQLIDDLSQSRVIAVLVCRQSLPRLAVHDVGLDEMAVLGASLVVLGKDFTSHPNRGAFGQTQGIRGRIGLTGSRSLRGRHAWAWAGLGRGLCLSAWRGRTATTENDQNGHGQCRQESAGGHCGGSRLRHDNIVVTTWLDTSQTNQES